MRFSPLTQFLLPLEWQLDYHRVRCICCFVDRATKTDLNLSCILSLMGDILVEEKKVIETGGVLHWHIDASTNGAVESGSVLDPVCYAWSWQRLTLLSKIRPWVSQQEPVGILLNEVWVISLILCRRQSIKAFCCLEVQKKF